MCGQESPGTRRNKVLYATARCATHSCAPMSRILVWRHSTRTLLAPLYPKSMALLLIDNTTETDGPY